MASDGIRLDSTQREVILGELANLLARPLPPAVRESHENLKQYVEGNLDVPSDLEVPLAMMIEASIMSGNARRFGAGVRQSMVALFEKTRPGKAIAQSIAAVNSALSQTGSHTIETISATLRAPGCYAMTLKTDQLQMVIVFDRTGLSIESLEVNLG